MFWVKKNKEILTIGIDNKKSSFSMYDRESDSSEKKNPIISVIVSARINLMYFYRSDSKYPNRI